MILFAPLENNIGKIFENFQSINQATVRDKLLMESDVWSLSTPQGSVPDYLYTTQNTQELPILWDTNANFQLNFIYLFILFCVDNGRRISPRLSFRGNAPPSWDQGGAQRNCDSDRESLDNTVHQRSLSLLDKQHHKHQKYFDGQ